MYIDVLVLKTFFLVIIRIIKFKKFLSYLLFFFLTREICASDFPSRARKSWTWGYFIREKCNKIHRYKIGCGKAAGQPFAATNICTDKRRSVLSFATKEQLPLASLSAQWSASWHAQRLSNLPRPGLSLSNVHPKLVIAPNLSFHWQVHRPIL